MCQALSISVNLDLLQCQICLFVGDYNSPKFATIYDQVTKILLLYVVYPDCGI